MGCSNSSSLLANPLERTRLRLIESLFRMKSKWFSNTREDHGQPLDGNHWMTMVNVLLLSRRSHLSILIRLLLLIFLHLVVLLPLLDLLLLLLPLDTNVHSMRNGQLVLKRRDHVKHRVIGLSILNQFPLVNKDVELLVVCARKDSWEHLSIQPNVSHSMHAILLWVITQDEIPYDPSLLSGAFLWIEWDMGSMWNCLWTIVF